MKFNQRTVQILRNFSTINEGLIFKTGNVIQTATVTKTIKARAKLNADVEKQFAVAELPKFLSALSLFEEPELNVTDTTVVIGSGGEKLKYTLAEPSLIRSPSEREIVLPSIDVQFQLKNDILNRVMKALGIIGAPEIAITGDGEKVYLEVINTSNPSSSTYKVEVGTTDKKFQLIFLADNIKILPGDYDVDICKSGIAHFKSDDLEYWMPFEHTSTFED